jgi:hypothetical protein
LEVDGHQVAEVVHQLVSGEEVHLDEEELL